jgi:hypothetical protein
LLYHSGLESTDANKAKFRKILQDSMISSGYPLKEVAESALQEVRMFKGTPGGGIDVLPEMLRAATTEAMLKGGSTPQEAMTALIGLSHMTKEYSPEAIKKLAPAFAFLSTANPARLASIERSAGYAVPLLQSGLEIDPLESLLLGTALTRAGATNTKSGTWLREMALRAMPGTSLQSKQAFKKHEAAPARWRRQGQRYRWRACCRGRAHWRRGRSRRRSVNRTWWRRDRRPHRWRVRRCRTVHGGPEAEQEGG